MSQTSPPPLSPEAAHLVEAMHALEAEKQAQV